MALRKLPEMGAESCHGATEAAIFGATVAAIFGATEAAGHRCYGSCRKWALKAASHWRYGSCRSSALRKPLVSALGDIVEGSARVSGKSLLAKRRSMKQAEGNVREVLVDGVAELVSAPFVASISEASVCRKLALNFLKIVNMSSGLLHLFRHYV